MNPRRRSLATVSVAACLITSLMFPAYALGQGASTRIRFRRGESSTTVSGRLSSRRLKQTFIIGAREGQELYLQIKARTNDGLDFANVMVFDPSGRGVASDDGGMVRLRLGRTGDYRLEVTPPGSFYNERLKGYKRLQFSLFVSVT